MGTFENILAPVAQLPGQKDNVGNFFQKHEPKVVSSLAPQQPEADSQQQQTTSIAETTPVSPPLVQPPPQPIADGGSMTYEELYKKLNPYAPPTTEELEKEKKRQKRDQMFAAIGDGVSALSNLFFTTKGAPNMYDGKNTASERTQIRYDKLLKDREANSKVYFEGLYRAKQVDEADRNWKRQLGLDEKADARYEDETKYRRGRDKVADDRYQEQDEYKKTRDALGDEWKQKEFDMREKQYGKQDALAWFKANSDKEYREFLKENKGGGSKTEKKLPFHFKDGTKIEISESTWKANYPVFQDILEGAGVDTPISWLKNAPSAAQVEHYIKRNKDKLPKEAVKWLSDIAKGEEAEYGGSNTEDSSIWNNDNDPLNLYH